MTGRPAVTEAERLVRVLAVISFQFFLDRKINPWDDGSMKSGAAKGAEGRGALDSWLCVCHDWMNM